MSKESKGYVIVCIFYEYTDEYYYETDHSQVVKVFTVRDEAVIEKERLEMEKIRKVNLIDYVVDCDESKFENFIAAYDGIKKTRADSLKSIDLSTLNDKQLKSIIHLFPVKFYKIEEVPLV